MGNCVAGGAYLPVLCDTVLMTEGSGLYLAGPALVKAAIGQEISHEELGGAHVHAAISGTVDYREPDDDACLARLRRLIALLPPDPDAAAEPTHDRAAGAARRRPLHRGQLRPVGAVRRARPARGDPRRRPARRVSRRVRPDARLRLRPAGRDRAGDRGDASGCGSGPRGAARSSSAA